MQNNYCISIDGVSKSFGEKTVIENLSLKIGEGELFGLLGPSGAGKTTLIKILTGQLKYKGKAEILGSECSGIKRDLYKQIGIVADNCGLYERLSCIDNLIMFAKIKRVNKDEAYTALKRVGLEKSAKTPAERLSKGMRQRLCLARAIIGEPKLLFLDEPTSGLDPTNAKEIHKLLTELKEKGTTIFLTTHNMEEAHTLCDNIALLSEGGIVEYGNPDEICRRHNKEKTLAVLTKSGEEITLPCAAESSEKIAEMLKMNAIESIHSSEPSLETVFIDLTGRGFEQ